MDYKIIMFKVEKQIFFNPSKVEILSLSNFLNIHLYFFNDKFSFYGKKLS